MKRSIVNFIKTHIGLSITMVLLLGAVWMQLRLQDQYTTVLQADDAGIRCSVENLDRLKEDGSPYKGILFYTKELFLQKGEYTVTVKYRAAAQNAKFVFYCNEDGRTLSQTPVEYTGNNCEMVIPLHLSSDAKGLTLQVDYDGNGYFSMDQVTVQSVGAIDRDYILLFVLAVLAVAGIAILYYRCPDQRSRYAGIFLLAVVVLVSYPLYCNYLIRGHDFVFHINRIEGIANGLRSGQFPVRIHTSTVYDYGQPTSVFYPELFLYVPAILRVLGASLTRSAQIGLFLLNLGTAYICYFSCERLFASRSKALVSAMLYTFSIYRLNQVYMRFALGEALAMMFLPLAVYGIYELFYGDEKRWYILVIAFTGIFESHIITTLLTAIACVVYGVFHAGRIFRKPRLLALVKTAVGTVLVNLWFLLPFVQFNGNTMFYKERLQRELELYAVNPLQLFQVFTSSSMTKVARYNAVNQVVPMYIGLPLVLVLIMAVFYHIQNRNADTKSRIAASCVIFGSICMLVSTNLFPWALIQRIPGLTTVASYIQFPWRWLSYGSAVLSMAGGYYVIELLDQKYLMQILTACLALNMVSAGWFMDFCIQSRPAQVYKGETVQSNGIGGGEYLYTGTDVAALKQRGKQIESNNDSLQITDWKRNGNRMDFSYQMQKQADSYIELPLLYYEGYAVTVDGQEVAPEIGDNNVIRIPVTKEKAGIHIEYRGFWYWHIADGISVLTVLLWLVWYIRQYRQRRKESCPLPE